MKTKKMTAILLVTFLIFSMGTTAFASEEGPELDKNTAEIKATYSQETTDPDPSYYVEVEWGSMEYTYNSGNGSTTWNPETLKFEETGETSGWHSKSGADKIKVTNHSNVDVAIGLSYEQAENDVQGTFDNDNFLLSAATEGSAYADGDSKTATLKISGTPEVTQTEKKQIGTVNLTVKGIKAVGELKPDDPNISPGTIYSTGKDGVYTVTVKNETSSKISDIRFSFTLDGTNYGLGSNNKIITSGSKHMYPLGAKYAMVITLDINSMTYSYTTMKVSA